MSDPLTRRRFIAALAASVVAVGAPLPIGFPHKFKSNIELSKWELFKHFHKEALGQEPTNTYVLQLYTAAFTP